MRDIRGDLLERADLLQDQISTAQNQFNKLVEQLKREHATRLDGLKSGLDAVRTIIGIEDHRAGSPPPATNAQSELKAPRSSRPQPVQSQHDLLARRVAAVSGG
jgi:hypothetical protein